MNTTTLRNHDISVPMSTLSSLVSLLREAGRSITLAPERAGECLATATDLLCAIGGPAPKGEECPTLKTELSALAPWQIRKVAVYVEQNLATRLEPAQMADLVGLSIPYFSRSFKKSVGVPPGQYILWRRVKRAAQLMADPNRLLIDIALDCGFADQSHFTRCFKRVFRLSPGVWRRYHLDVAAVEKQ